MIRWYSALAPVTIALFVSACGGGDGAGGPVQQRLTQAFAASAGGADCAHYAAAGCSAISGVPAPRRLAAVPTISDVDLFDWAAMQYPVFFRDGFQAGSVLYQGWTYDYRYFPATDTYLAVRSDSGVYVLADWTGGQPLRVGALADFACAVQPTGCGLVAPTALQQVTTFIGAFDQYLAGAAGSGQTSFEDGCYLDAGETKAWLLGRMPSANEPSQAYRIGSRRTNVAITAERFKTNFDGSKRHEVDITYNVAYPDGSSTPGRQTLVSGSSFGACQTPDNLAGWRFFGDQHVVGVSAVARDIRAERYQIANGLPDATPLTYRREVYLRVADPIGVATYAIVTGPGPSATVNGQSQPFSWKLISPRIVSSAPEMQPVIGDYLNFKDTDFFRLCRAPSIVVGSGTYIANVADCVGQGSQLPSWGWTLSNPSASNVAAADTGFANQGWMAGGLYTFAIYADDGWKTVNGQAGKTPIATYTATLSQLPYTFASMLGSGTTSDNFPRLTGFSPDAQAISFLMTAGSASNLNLSWAVPTAPDGRKFALQDDYEYFEGPSAAAGGASFPSYRYSNVAYPAASATADNIGISQRPTELLRKSYGEFGIEYSDRQSVRIVEQLQLR